MEPIRLVIADDHTFYREGIRTILHMVAGIEVIGEAATGEEVIAQALEKQPDVILMDIKMPGLNGIEATRQILSRRPQTKILVVTMFEDDDSVFAAMRAGARGYLVKDADKEELVRAIQAIYRDEAIFSHPASDGPWTEQYGDCTYAEPEPQNGAEPCLEYLRQTASRRSCRSDCARP